MVSRFETDRAFQMNGTMYEHADRRPDHTGHTVHRFTYKQEPEVIAQVPLVDGVPLEVHGYATFWTQEEVDVAWTDDRGSTYQCWVPRFTGTPALARRMARKLPPPIRQLSRTVAVNRPW
jgi:hypothetical protein